MGCMTKNPAVRRFYTRTAVTVGAYIAVLLFVAFYFYRLHPHGLCAYLLALLPAIALTGFIVTIGLYLAEEKDEFQRDLMVQALLWGLGGVLVFTSAWGSLETFIHIRHFQPTWTYSIFWFFFILRTPFLMWKYR